MLLFLFIFFAKVDRKIKQKDFGFICFRRNFSVCCALAINEKIYHTKFIAQAFGIWCKKSRLPFVWSVIMQKERKKNPIYDTAAGCSQKQRTILCTLPVVWSFTMKWFRNFQSWKTSLCRTLYFVWFEFFRITISLTLKMAMLMPRHFILGLFCVIYKEISRPLMQ